MIPTPTPSFASLRSNVWLKAHHRSCLVAVTKSIGKTTGLQSRAVFQGCKHSFAELPRLDMGLAA
jgi:hypothetical protein